jgi:hypothetical protein
MVMVRRAVDSDDMALMVVANVVAIVSSGTVTVSGQCRRRQHQPHDQDPQDRQ